MREFIEYKGEKFWLQTSGRYFQSGRHSKNARERLLHRRIWIDNFGPIPKGVDIHHLDGNWRNNELKNLELKSRAKHQSEHMLESMADPIFRARAMDGLKKAIAKAPEWHASPEGIEWHRQNSLRMWGDREPVPAVCTVCEKKYVTYFESRSEYCSDTCGQKVRIKNYKTAEGTCLQCGAKFLFNRHKKEGQECCSRGCAIRRRLGHTPATTTIP